MPAKSKAQQRFFGLVRSVQKGETPKKSVSKEVRDAAKDMSVKDVRDFASTKTKKLPNKVTENRLGKILKEVVEEGFGKFRKFPKATSQQQGQTDGKRRGKLQIAGCRTEMRKSAVTGEMKEYIAVYLGHVWGDGAESLVNAINGAVPKHIMNAIVTPPDGNIKGRDGGRVLIRVNIDMKNEIPNAVNKMAEAIKQLNDYTESSVDKVCDTIFDRVDNVVTSKDEENAQNMAVSNWQEMLQKLNDPEVRKRLLAYQMTDDYARAYGHVLSPGNVNKILNQFPNASFVAEKHTWEAEFNRRVAPGAQRIIVTKPNERITDKTALDDAARRCGFANYRDAKMRTNGATQVMNQIEIMASKSASGFKNVIMFDVSQTIPPSDPKLDRWTIEFGLTNNLHGVMNSKSVELDSHLSAENKELIDRNKQKISAAQQARNKNRRNVLTTLCRVARVDMSQMENYDDNEFIAKASYQYAKAMLPKFGIIHPKQMEKIASLCAVATCISCGIDTVPNTYTNAIANGSTTQEEAMTVATITSQIFPKLSKATRTPDIEMVKTESIIRGLNEAQTGTPISLAQFINICKEYFGVDEQADATNEVREKIGQIVKEEVVRLLKRK